MSRPNEFLRYDRTSPAALKNLNNVPVNDIQSVDMRQENDWPGKIDF
jgi:hypothetical protein